MRARRALMAAFAALSLLFVLDVVLPASGTFGGVFDESIFEVDLANSWTVPPDYEESRSLERLAIAQGERVAVRGTIGDLRVTESDSGEAAATYTVRVWGRGDAAAFARQLSLSWRREDGQAVLVFESPEKLAPGMRAVEVDVELAVPKGAHVSVDHRGNLSVEGLSGELEFEHFGGEARIRDVQGPVTAAGRYGSVTVSGVAGPVRVSHFLGEVVIRDVAGPVSGETRFSTVTVERPAGFVELNVMMGTASVKELRGGADLRMQYGELEVGLAPGGGWNIQAVAEMGELETNMNLARTQDGPRVEVSGVVGDGREPLAIYVSQGVGKLFGTP